MSDTVGQCRTLSDNVGQCRAMIPGHVGLDAGLDADNAGLDAENVGQ